MSKTVVRVTLRASLLSLCIACGASFVDAQEPWQITLVGDPGNAMTANVRGLSVARATEVPPGDAPLTVVCEDDLPCTAVEARIAFGQTTRDVQLESAAEDTAEFTIGTDLFLGLAAGDTARLEVLMAGARISTFMIVRPGGDGDARNDAVRRTPLATILATPCRMPNATAGYLAEANRASFIVTSVGNVLAGPSGSIDEDDEVVVHMQVPTAIEQSLIVRRTSEIRDLTVLRVAGGDVEIPGGFELMVEGEPNCSPVTVTLRDFAPGEAEVGIFVRTTEGEEQVGSFTFAVSPLYAGSFTLGPVRSWVGDPSFGVVPSAGEAVVTETERDGRPVRYVLMFTPFVWGKRDFNKPVPFHQRLNPTLGVTLSDIGDNALAGVSFDAFNVVFLTFGAHLGKVTRLDRTGGAAIGEPVPGGGDTAPTTEDWVVRQFYGVTIDLRAAVQFLSRAMELGGG